MSAEPGSVRPEPDKSAEPGSVRPEPDESAEPGNVRPESAEPGTVRPGGRTARVRAAVLRAAGDVLAEEGFAHLDLADVARRAEVG